MPFTVSSSLAVSRREPLDCGKLAEFLGKAGIITDVTSNTTMQPNKEYGCRLVQSISSKEDIRNIWTKLEKEYGFSCAHVSVGNQFDGCVLNFLAPCQCAKRNNIIYIEN